VLQLNGSWLHISALNIVSFY